MGFNLDTQQQSVFSELVSESCTLKFGYGESQGHATFKALRLDISWVGEKQNQLFTKKSPFPLFLKRAGAEAFTVRA